MLPWQLLYLLGGQAVCKLVCLVDDVLVHPRVEDCGVEGHFYWPIFGAECR